MDNLPKRSDKEIQYNVNKLLNKMTLKEKIGQLYQQIYSNKYATGPTTTAKSIEKLIKKDQIGSILSLYDTKKMYKLQKLSIEESRLKIPLFFANDIIHGYRTCFPIPLAMSCSWNLDLIKRQAQISAYEASHNGINMTYSPMIDLVRDPRWGRVMEANGEDPYLSSQIALSYVKGYQGEDLSNYNTLGACCKHFIGYGKVEGGRDYNTVDMSDRTLRQYYLPPFKTCIDNNIAAIMTSFNVINDIPMTGNKKLVKELLKKELKFNGFIISDYNSSMEMINHKYAKDEKDVALKSLEAGIDIEMISESFINNLEELVNSKEIPLNLIDDAVKRVLTFKYKIGLFDNPYKNFYEDSNKYLLLKENREIALKIAEESIVLLKNNNVLPIDKNKMIAVIGPFGKSKNVNGEWDALSRDKDSTSIYDASKQYKDYKLKFSDGCDILGNDDSKIDKAVDIAKKSDVIILAVGEDKYMSGEAASRSNLDLPNIQKKLVKEILKLNKKTILVVHAGRPLILTDYESKCDAIVYAWFLGNESGKAILNTLLGFNNPSGKLTMSFPYSVGQIPVYYNHFSTGRGLTKENKNQKYISKYLDIPNEPLYSFGYGLSYTKFKYKNIKTNKKTFYNNESFIVSVDVENIGDYDGEEIVECYIEATNFSVVRPVNELKGFKKIHLKKGETKKVLFTLRKEDLAYFNIDMNYICEEGLYYIKIGSSSNKTIKTKIKFKP